MGPSVSPVEETHLSTKQVLKKDFLFIPSSDKLLVHTESPRRYVESDVNIHYRCPVRHDPLPLVPERELARQQAEHMKRLYREQKRNKYLQVNIFISRVCSYILTWKRCRNMNTATV